MDSKLEAALGSLKSAVRDVQALDRSIGQLRAVYTEILVASRLSDMAPQQGYQREDSSADVYLGKIRKRVEVKADEKGVFSGAGEYPWAISPNQLKKPKIDYKVTVGYSGSLNVEKVFVFTAEDFKREPVHNPGFVRDLGGIAYGTNYRGSTPLERRLHARPQDYESRWDRIR